MDQKIKDENDAQKGMRLLNTRQPGSPFGDWIDEVYEVSNDRWRELADRGDAEFCWLLGAAYGYSHVPNKFEAKQQGKKFEPPWQEESIAAQKPWFRKAAELGHAESQYELAQLLSDDNPLEAFDLRLQAANSRLAKAMHSVAAAYVAGLGVAKNYDQAHHWMSEAAASGDKEAQVKLLVYKFEGIGPMHDPDEAERELKVLATRGNETAKSVLWTWKNRRENGLM